jgi:lysophospholipase L1-like esterase
MDTDLRSDREAGTSIEAVEQPRDDVIDRPPPGRSGMPAGRVLIAMLVCMLAWGLLYAPELKRSALAQPEGPRRTVALAILDPVVWVTDHVGLTSVADQAARALGRNPDAAVGGVVGGVPVEVDQIPTYSPAPSSPSPEGGSTGTPLVDTPIRVPTGKDKLRVAVVGDSLAAGVGYYAERVFKPFFVDVTKQGRISTGLARPDYFNWQAQMKYLVDRYQPDLTLVMLGENDRQSLLTPAGGVDTRIGTFDWPKDYERRVIRFAKRATSRGGHVVWIGLPVVRDQERNAFNEKIDAIFQDAAEKLPNVAFFDTAEAFSTPSGDYTAYYRDGNKVVLVRADDGLHFNGDGYTLLMEKVVEFTAERFDLDQKAYEG